MVFPSNSSSRENLPVAGEFATTRNEMLDRKELRTSGVDQLLMQQLENSQRNTRRTIGDEQTNNFVHPRVVSLDHKLKILDTLNPFSRKVEPMIHDRINLEGDQETDYYIRDFERPYFDHCKPMVVQPAVHPTCNPLHELQLDQGDITLISMKGSWRSVWKVFIERRPVGARKTAKNETPINTTLLLNVTTDKDVLMTSSIVDASQSVLVLKMLHFHRTFDIQSFEAHATDIMVMDRLTASSYVVNAYGFCGQSVLTEYATSTGRDYVKRYDVRNSERLRVARDLAFGLADIQALRPFKVRNITNFVPLFAHNDINIANTVMVNGRMKWNDFNIGERLRRKRKEIDQNATITSFAGNSSFVPFASISSRPTDEVCPAPVKFESHLWRSPEEIRNNSYVRSDLSDMYGFGNVLYQIMTRHQPWTFKEPIKLENEDVRKLKLDGLIPTIPEQYRNTTRKELQVMFVATVACYEPDPNRRPSIEEMAY